MKPIEYETVFFSKLLVLCGWPILAASLAVLLVGQRCPHWIRMRTKPTHINTDDAALAS